MCGIAGIADVTGRPVDQSLLRAMTGVQAHRGPDGEAVVCRGTVGLGHRRLAIIDLATGDQPMSSDDGRVWIVFNGEIYNFRELRSELEAAGARFRTKSDTEVILRAYEADGPACVSRLRGMFAFAILDERHRRLVLARDRVGIKPLVYSWDGHRLLFASEIKGILEDRTVTRDLDPAALGEYLTYHYVPQPRTIFTSVRKLPPASLLVLPLDGGAPEITRYWRLRFAPDTRVTEAEWIERLQAELADAVRSHMVSDVPIGAFLSGGVDSSTVVAFMAEASPTPIRTFSIGFDEADFDELRFARQVATRYGTDHYELVVKPAALDVLPKLVWHLDEPFADASAIPTYYVSKITREHVTVALSGDGGDHRALCSPRHARAAGNPPTRSIRRMAPGSRNHLRSAHVRAATSDEWRPRPRIRPSVHRHGDVPAGRHSGQGGPDEHGRLPREPRPPARPSAAGIRGDHPELAQAGGRRGQAHSQACYGRPAPHGDPHTAEDGLRCASRRVVPRRASRHGPRSAARSADAPARSLQAVLGRGTPTHPRYRAPGLLGAVVGHALPRALDAALGRRQPQPRPEGRLTCAGSPASPSRITPTRWIGSSSAG